MTATVQERARVLVVDDEDNNRALLRALLSRNYEVLETASGVEALRLVDADLPDLVLLDVMMPDISGFEVCKEIKRRRQNLPFLPVLLVTGLSGHDEKMLGFEADADDFITKPVDRRELALRVRAFLRIREQDRLIRAQLKQVADLQHTKDEMLSLMVHDLRSPLSGVIAHLNLVLEDVCEGRVREDLLAALRGADAIRDALEEALQIRLLEAGHLPIVRAPVNLETLIAAAVDTLEAVGRRKRIAVSRSVEGEPVASVDGKLLRRAMENLLANALKYTPAGGDVFIAARHIGDGVQVEIGDRGPGIPAALKPGMFQKYGSVEAKKGGTRKGFGLGLYMVKLVAEGHHGDADVLDREGGGAVFRVRLRE